MAGSLKKLTNNPKGQENTYKLTVSHGFGDNGKRLREYKTIHVTSDKAAEKALAAFVTEIEKGEFTKPCEYSFDELFEKWINSHQGDKRLAPKTEARYREMYDLRIKDYFCKYKVDKINATVIDDFFTELRKSKRKDGRKGSLSEQSIKHHYRLMSAVFAYAYRKQLIKSNPMEFAEPISVKQKQAVCFDELQVSALIDILESVELKFKTIIHLDIASGCRLGEIVGLTWDDIDFDNSTINIKRTAQYIPDFNKIDFLKKYPSYFDELLSQGIVSIINNNVDTIKYIDSLLDRHIIIKDPKNEKSIRTIKISRPVMDLLSQYQHEQKVKQVKAANKWHKGFSWVFTEDFGDLMHPQTPSKWFHKLIKSNNGKVMADQNICEEEKQKYLIKEVSFHGLRHTSASLLISKGKDVVTIANRLGHSNSNTTLKIYAHAFEKLDQEAADSLDNLFKKKNDENKTNRAN